MVCGSFLSLVHKIQFYYQRLHSFLVMHDMFSPSLSPGETPDFFFGCPAHKVWEPLDWRGPKNDIQHLGPFFKKQQQRQKTIYYYRN